jgi:hypothetical protein
MNHAAGLLDSRAVMTPHGCDRMKCPLHVTPAGPSSTYIRRNVSSSAQRDYLVRSSHEVGRPEPHGIHACRSVLQAKPAVAPVHL